MQCVKICGREGCKVAKKLNTLRCCGLDRKERFMKYVQISRELFFKLLSYHLLDKFEEKEEIEKGLEAKLNTMVNHEIYSKSKTAPTEEEREKSRQEYLDRVGIHPDFRW